MGLFDKLGLGATRSFYTRDFRNNYRLRPDVNPPRQKFQGYVNFILNRSLFGELYAAGADGNLGIRTEISSLVRKATLPDVTFKTETKNAYNRKKVVNTGLEFSPVTITVMDTVGNEWLGTIMNYFSYHYMNVRNKSDPVSDARNMQDPPSSIETTAGTSFGKTTNADGQAAFTFNSNSYGYNPNANPNFFERIDFILYHGNKGVQYSITNPVLTQFKIDDLDYASSDIMSFELTFAYENFIPYSVTNFQLSQEDVNRFEQGYKFEGPAFVAGSKPQSLDSAVTLGTLGSVDPTEFRSRTAQPSPRAASTANTTVAATPDIYGEAGAFVKATGKSKKPGFLEDLLSNAAGSAIGAALSGRSVKNAVLGSALGTVRNRVLPTVTGSTSDAVRRLVRPASSTTAANPAASGPAPAPVSPPAGGG